MSGGAPVFRDFFSRLRVKAPFIVLTGAIIFIMYICDLGCPIQRILNKPCPGCGLTRSVITVFSLEFKKALALHPMVWSLPILFLFFLYDGALFKRKLVNFGILLSILTGFLIQWLIRLF